jgi:hypothetical protein
MEFEIGSPPAAAFELLRLHRSGDFVLTRKAGQFCGQVVAAGDEPLTEAQARWLAQLMDKAGLPEFSIGDA